MTIMLSVNPLRSANLRTWSCKYSSPIRNSAAPDSLHLLLFVSSSAAATAAEMIFWVVRGAICGRIFLSAHCSTVRIIRSGVQDCSVSWSSCSARFCTSWQPALDDSDDWGGVGGAGVGGGALLSLSTTTLPVDSMRIGVCMIVVVVVTGGVLFLGIWCKTWGSRLDGGDWSGRTKFRDNSWTLERSLLFPPPDIARLHATWIRHIHTHTHTK